jgi:hypothetical protein
MAVGKKNETTPWKADKTMSETVSDIVETKFPVEAGKGRGH